MQGYLRIFSMTGLQKIMLSWPGQVVCMSGTGSQLAIVHHDGIDPTNQHMTFTLMNVMDLKAQAPTYVAIRLLLQ